jgi:hypothetical protein
MIFRDIPWSIYILYCLNILILDEMSNLDDVQSLQQLYE